MNRIISALLVYILCINSVYALAVPAYSGKMNNAVGSIIHEKIKKQGFAANDPRYGATISATQTAATAVAVGLATGAVATVGWPALLIGAGISGVVAGAVALGADGLVNWIWPDENSDQTKITVSETLTGSVPLSQLPGPWTEEQWASMIQNPGDYYYRLDNGHGSHIKVVRFICPGAAFGVFCGSGNTRVGNALNSNMDSSTIPADATVRYFPNAYIWQTDPSNSYNKIYNVLYFEQRKYSNTWLSYVDQETYPVVYRSVLQQPEQSISDIPEGYATQPLSDAQLAAIANAVWNHASAANNPQAIPYPATDPITASDISEWKQANPEKVPTVSDFASPVAAPGTSVVSIPLIEPEPNPDSEQNPDPSTPPATTAIEWGSLSPPALEATPTTASILDPIFSMWPQWNNFAFPAHASACPTPTFEALNHTFTFDHLCTWIEMIREPLQASFAIMWAFLVMLIVMGA